MQESKYVFVFSELISAENKNASKSVRKVFLMIKIGPGFMGSLVYLMTHNYRGSQQSSREVKPKFIDSTQGEPKNIYKP
jgi:hypothetical protein